MRKFIGLLAIVASAASLGCSQAPTPLSPESAPAQGHVQGPIVGGTTESGWPSVGALATVYPGVGYMGSFCTATLISNQWLLTAAHCLGNQNGLDVTPQIVRFYVGNNANPSGFADAPASGTLYKVSQFIVHPNYDPDDPEANYDIALVKLAAPLNGVTPVAINNSAMTGSWIGDPVTYVGFGVSNGATETGGGVKRKAIIDISFLDTLFYGSEFNGANVCFGDSGGPGLMQIGGQWRVVGVNSSVANSGADPCKGISLQSRVDVFASWINTQMNAPTPSCKVDSTLCACAAACGANGTCNNALCQTKSCFDIYECMGGCAQTDQGCVVDCYFTGTTAGQQQFDDMSICMAEQCDGLQGDAFNECAADNCGPEIDACFPPLGTGNDSCEEVYTCLGDCAQGDNDCTLACFEEGSATAQDQINAMLTCFEEECGTLTGDAFSECAFEECAEPVQACFPAANCDLTGGDCPAGQACYPVQGGETDCFETEGGKAGASCNPNVNSVGLTCGDGLFCYPSGTSTGKCESFCFTDADCAADNTSCVAPLFTDGDVGYCAPCTDADKDGYCQGDDCNDGQAATNPGADEKCGDNVDNDCDGQKDEGCAAEDEGGESSDEGAESSDEGAESSDEGAESSDEGAESSDEGAESSDEGGDSSDEGAESSDEGGESSDEGAESADEGGGTCVDSDNDGVCAKADCDDTNPNAAPGQTELCGDNADNDCDGEVDNGCGSGSGREASGDGGAGGDGGGGASDGGAGGGGGGCSATGGSTGAPLWALGALALVFARRRRSSHR